MTETEYHRLSQELACLRYWHRAQPGLWGRADRRRAGWIRWELAKEDHRRSCGWGFAFHMLAAIDFSKTAAMAALVDHPVQRAFWACHYLVRSAVEAAESISAAELAESGGNE